MLVARNQDHQRRERDRFDRLITDVDAWLATASAWSPAALERACAHHERAVGEVRTRSSGAPVSEARLHDDMVLRHALRPWVETLRTEELVPLLAASIARPQQQSWPIDPPVSRQRTFVSVSLAAVPAAVPTEHAGVLRHEISSYSTKDDVDYTTSLGSVFRNDPGTTVVLWVYEQTKAVMNDPFQPIRVCRLG
ncbi:hypothetical protein [Actinomadura yumaensis]|uniref:Uncharacterized protein n=1 Tax=Actinomadura yumaensis TaxID=111807 RepID=A0ABW2CE72_9ACTN